MINEDNKKAEQTEETTTDAATNQATAETTKDAAEPQQERTDWDVQDHSTPESRAVLSEMNYGGKNADECFRISVSDINKRRKYITREAMDRKITTVSELSKLVEESFTYRELVFSATHEIAKILSETGGECHCSFHEMKRTTEEFLKTSGRSKEELLEMTQKIGKTKLTHLLDLALSSDDRPDNWEEMMEEAHDEIQTLPGSADEFGDLLSDLVGISLEINRRSSDPKGTYTAEDFMDELRKQGRVHLAEIVAAAKIGDVPQELIDAAKKEQRSFPREIVIKGNAAAEDFFTTEFPKILEKAGAGSVVKANSYTLTGNPVQDALVLMKASKDKSVSPEDFKNMVKKSKEMFHEAMGLAGFDDKKKKKQKSDNDGSLHGKLDEILSHLSGKK